MRLLALPPGWTYERASDGQFWLVTLMFSAIAVTVMMAGRHARKRIAEMQGVPVELMPTRENRTFPKEYIRAAEKFAREHRIPSDNPPLIVGDVCVLLGDDELGPLMMVVDCNDTHVIGAWDQGDQEIKLSREIVRRYRDPEYVVPA